MPFFFHIYDDYIFLVFKYYQEFVEDLCKKLFSVNNRNTKFNRRRPTGSKGRWQKAISVSPSRAGPMIRNNLNSIDF